MPYPPWLIVAPSTNERTNGASMTLEYMCRLSMCTKFRALLTRRTQMKDILRRFTARLPWWPNFTPMIYPITVVSSKASGAGEKDNNSWPATAADDRCVRFWLLPQCEIVMNFNHGTPREGESVKICGRIWPLFAAHVKTLAQTCMSNFVYNGCDVCAADLHARFTCPFACFFFRLIFFAWACCGEALV